MRLAIAQIGPAGSIAASVRHAIELLATCSEAGADLLLLPEGHLAPYFPQHPGVDVREARMHKEAPAIRQLAEACRAYRIAALPNLYVEAEGDSQKGYSASPLIDANGTLLGWSNKIHITRTAGFYEQDYFVGSPQGIACYPLCGVTVAPIICFDRHYPECFRTAAEQGARLVLIPVANVRGEPLDLFEWEMRVAARRYGLHVAMCNRVGKEGALDFCGGSMVVRPDGDCLARMGDGAGLLYVDLDMGGPVQ